MNCKPGDVIVPAATTGPYAGKRFMVLYAAPDVMFRLPNGNIHAGVEEDSWVLRSLDGAVTAPLASGDTRETVYGVAPDRACKVAEVGA